MHKSYRTVAAIAASSLLAAFAAQANKGADYHKESSSSPAKRFTLTGGATYLEPSLNDLAYVSLVTPTSVAFSDSVDIRHIDPEFSWGYFLGFGYMISKHYDVQATWAQYDSDLTETTSFTNSVAGGGYITSNNEFDGMTVGDVLTAHSHETLKYQVFDATLGQYHNITRMLYTRLFAGLRYAKVDSEVTNVYSETGDSDIFDEYDSSFSGVGPEVGLELEYKIYQRFGVVGALAAAFLVGDIDADSHVFATGGQQTVKGDEDTRLIPALNAKLGLNWDIPYGTKDWAFGVEGGYQVAYYYNVVDQIQYQPNEGELTHNYTDVGMMGPYLNFSAMF